MILKTNGLIQILCLETWEALKHSLLIVKTWTT